MTRRTISLIHTRTKSGPDAAPFQADVISNHEAARADASSALTVELTTNAAAPHATGTPEDRVGFAIARDRHVRLDLGPSDLSRAPQRHAVPSAVGDHRYPPRFFASQEPRLAERLSRIMAAGG